MSIAALVLAAGGSRRLGRPKQLEPWGDTTLLGRVLAWIASHGLEEQWVVLGAHADEVLDVVDLTGWHVVENLEWEEGIASSLRVGLDALTQLSEVETVVVAMGDQPEIHRDVVPALLDRHAESHGQVTLPKYRYARANPVVIDRSLWPRLMSLDGDDGAMRLFQAHPEWVTEVWFPHLPPRDVDTQLDVDELRPRRRGMRG